MPTASAATTPTGIDYAYSFSVNGSGSATYDGTAVGTDDNGNPCSMQYTEQVSWRLHNVLAAAERPIGQFPDGNFAISTYEGGTVNPFNHQPESSTLTVTISESGTCPAAADAASQPDVCGTSTSTVNTFAFPLGPAPIQLLGYGNLSGGTQCPYDPFAGLWDGNPEGVGGPCTQRCAIAGFSYVSGPADSAVTALDHYCTSTLSNCSFPRTIQISSSTPRSFCQGYGTPCTPPEQSGDGTWQDTGDSWQLTITAVPEATGPPLARCVVPRLRGDTLHRAIGKLHHAHCLLGTVTFRRSSRVPVAHVIASRPPAGTRKRPFYAVGLVLSRG